MNESLHSFYMYYLMYKANGHLETELNIVSTRHALFKPITSWNAD